MDVLGDDVEMDGIHGTLVLVDEPLHLFLEPLLMYVEPMMILIVKPLHIHCDVVMDVYEKPQGFQRIPFSC